MSYRWCVNLATNRAEVNDPEAARLVLEEYQSTLPLVVGVEGNDRVLTLEPHDPVNTFWPSAVEVADLRALGDDVDGETWPEDRAEVEELHETRGQDGLTAMLLKLAPYLTSPFTVQASECSNEGDFSGATEWTVRPGATEVEVKAIMPLADEPG